MVGNPALQGVTALPTADELPSLQTGSMVGEGAFTINDVIGLFRNGFAYSAMNNAGRMVILYEFFPHHLVTREGYEEVVPKQGEETDFSNAVAAYESSVQALREADYESLPRVTSTIWANGTFYVATEERSLQGYDKLMEAGSATGGKRPKVIGNAISQALEALIKMHGLGFEHGAITPDMIHISSEGDVRITGPILLTSLAVPTIRDGSGNEVPNPFIAPELLENPYGVSVKSDLYSLAASFYTAITRRPPPDAKSRAEAVALKVADNYSPLRKVAVLYRPAFRRALDAAMAYDPAERPNTAENWLAHIQEDAADEVATPVNESFLANIGKAAVVEVEAPAPAAPEPVAVPVVEEALVEVSAPVVEAPPAPPPAKPRVEFAPIQSPPPAAPPAAAGKSNMGVILGAGGLVAVLAVAGVMFMGGGEEPAPEPAPATETASDATAPVPTAIADAEAEAEAEAETQGATETAEATTEAETTPATTEPAATEPETTEVAAVEPTPAETPAETAEETPVEPETTTEPAPAVSEEQPEATAESVEVAAAPEAGSDVVAPAEQSETPAAEDTAQVLPAPPNAETAEISTEPAPALEPEPAPLSGDESEAAEVAENVRAADDLDDLLLGDQPDAGAQPATGGNATIDLSSSPVLQALSPLLPMQADASNPAVVGSVRSDAPEWLKPGVTIASVNGQAVASLAEIGPKVRSSQDLAAVTSVDLTLSVIPAEGGAAVDQSLTVPVVKEFALLNGLRFGQVPGSDGGQMVVTAAPPPVGDDQMHVGDVLTAFVPNNEKITAETDLAGLIERQLRSGATQFPFAVKRGEAMWITTFNYGLLRD